MRQGWIAAAMVSLAGSVAMAQRAAPQEEPGWTVVEIPGGYYRYETKSTDELKPEDRAAGGGGVTVEARARPTTAPVAATASVAPPAQAPAEQYPQVAPAAPAGMGPMGPPPRMQRCVAERRALAARLLYLRGIWFVDDSTAELVLAAEESPLFPQAYGFIPSYFTAGNSNLLFTAVSSDLIARTLAEDYARCLE